MPGDAEDGMVIPTEDPPSDPYDAEEDLGDPEPEEDEDAD